MTQSHPKPLSTLFFTELWERFGFYTLQAILVLYLTQRLNYTDKAADLLYGTFSSLLYLTPFIGGRIADHYLGFRRSVIIGGIFLCVGYAVMGIPDPHALFLGLSIVIIGNGLFKPNVSCLVGSLYHSHDPRKDSGFTLFYMGINIGSLLPPLFIGAFVAAYSWHAGFNLAAVGLVLALLIFWRGKKLLKTIGDPPASSPLFSKKRSLFWGLFTLGTLGTIGLCHLLLYWPFGASLVVTTSSAAIIGMILFFLLKEPRVQRKKLLACLILILLSIGFWAIYMQMFTSLILFAHRNVDRHLFGFPINTEFTLFFNPLFILLISPFLGRLWPYLENKHKNPSTPVKFSLGILCISLGFALLWIGTRYGGVSGILPLWWLIISYLVQTVGELLLSPIGLAMVTRLSPPHLVGSMMGVWFLTLAAAFAIGGRLASWASIPEKTSLVEALAIYSHAFFLYSLIALTLALLGFALSPYLKRLIGLPSLPISTPKE